MPKRLYSRTLGRLANHPLSRHLIGLFIWTYGIDKTEIGRPIQAFTSLQDFFTRRLPADARSIAQDAHLVSPVDGTVSAIGAVEDGQTVQAEGLTTDVEQLLKSPAEGWNEHDFAVMYLSPGTYHRVHSPCDGVVRRLEYQPGALWPVFASVTRSRPGLFEGNERLILEMDTNEGPVAVVMVGALGVGHITWRIEVGQAIGKGQEIGQFGLGSTVIVLTMPTIWRITPGDAVKMGQAIGSGVQG
ncbi:MAG: archaetidylserine decarboxylase [Myxococcota bacterium]